MNILFSLTASVVKEGDNIRGNLQNKRQSQMALPLV